MPLTPQWRLLLPCTQLVPRFHRDRGSDPVVQAESRVRAELRGRFCLRRRKRRLRQPRPQRAVQGRASGGARRQAARADGRRDQIGVRAPQVRILRSPQPRPRLGLDLHMII